MGKKKTVERELARVLYVSQRVTIKELSDRGYGTEKTIAKWRDEDMWDDERKSLLTTKSNQITRLYNQLDALTGKIMERDNIPTASEADTMSKITTAIERLETETSLGENVEVLSKFLNFVRDTGDLEAAKLLTRFADEFINSKLRKV